jgi:hypothetical protein
MSLPKDKNGNEVNVGTKVRLLSLSGQWLEDLPTDERLQVLSMIGEIFVIEEIDEDYGQPWIRKSWPNTAKSTCQSHSIALASEEMEIVDTVNSRQ